MDDYKYTSIDAEQRAERQGERRGQGWSWKRDLLAAVLIAIFSSVATIGIFSLMITIKTHEAQKPQCAQSPQMSQGLADLQGSQQFSCGETFDDAHQRGCKFDALTLSWLPSQCSQYGQKEFLDISKTSNNGSTWQYFEDREGQHELGGFEALSYLAPGSSYWMTNEAHLYHCVFMLWRVYDAATTGKRLDAKASAYEHTKHCLDMLAEQAKMGVGEKLSEIDVSGHLLDIGWNAC